ncbi:serine/threonine-protein kinase RIO3-like [Acanthaster planci]|uniref:Serine/threonine-protein kinase RIO3 n=1 Tax=Acanthaster planci TaxID=133434 RepID=A0A8B7ZFX2_ACAPL|nr:serine/threonine-protein kinase RIO3-like [Acanthaster planci]XP_022104553.1 serine/threonine-protein kinase RIO3-like [Acanthaster planci]XP_022104554.1 serine/threonine-protein kinase RIO3-like [Acanthaster planci]
MSSTGKVVTPVPCVSPAPNPWKVAAPTRPACSLASVMDEEFAKKLQKDEEALTTKLDPGGQLQAQGPLTDYEYALSLDTSGGNAGTDSDLLLAQMLQLQFDQEHDAVLAVEEKKKNANSKVSISYANFRAVHPAIGKDENPAIYADSDSDDDDDDIWEYTEKGVSSPKKTPTTKDKNGTMTTKHDAVICGRKNASKVMEKFPPGFNSGDDVGMDMKLPNNVFNTLKQHSQTAERKTHRVHEKKEHSTAVMAMDPNTRLLLYKLVNNGILESVNGTISTGKEAVVLHANGGQHQRLLVPRECALKVFKTTLNEFRTRRRYLPDALSRMNPRKIIGMWADKERMNLNMMRKAGIRCPEVILLKKHLLVMSFIGEHQRAAPKLKDAQLSPEDMQLAYDQCTEMMEKMYKQCQLVHADLSEYNMMWFNREVWFIDVSQSVKPFHPEGLKFLLRDCTNVSNFFTHRGVPNVATPRELFNRITDLNLQDGSEQEFIAQIEVITEAEEFKALAPKEKNFAFDYFFEQTTAERSERERKESEGKEGEPDEEAEGSN